MLTTTTDSKGEAAVLVNKLRPVLAEYPEIIFGYLFGSKAQGTDGALSDVDLAVYVQDARAFSFSRKLTLQGDCCRALQRNNVDLVVLNQTRNLMLLEQIMLHGLIILDHDPGQRLDFEVKILHQALDFKQQRERETGV
jgi:predicted nucleotidyltransferase